MKSLSPYAVVLLLAAGCATPKPFEAQETPATPGPQISTQRVESTAEPTLYEATGIVKAQFNAILASKATARVVSVLAREGSAVRRGQTLIVLDSRELSAGVQVAQANLSASVVGVDSARTAREMEVRTSSARIAQSEAAVLQSRAALGAAQSRLDLVLAGPRTQEKTQAHLAVIQAESSLRLAKTQLDRATRLVAEGALARKSLEEAQNTYELALAQRDTAVQAENIAQEGSRTEEIQSAKDGVGQAQAALKQAEANLAFARASALQAKVRTQEIASAKAQVSQSFAALRSAQVLLGYGAVAAPFDGRVVQRMADPGAMALPGSPLMALEGGPLRIEIVVPESVLAHVKPKEFIRLKIDALSREFEGTVDEIAPQGDAASHTFVAKVVISKPEGVRSGMFGRAFIATGTNRAIRVPKKSIWEREGLHYIYVVNDEGIARLRIVTLGESAGEKVSILSGLSTGDRIITGAREQVSDGMKVASK